jgi:hypothetical protein
MKSLHLLGWAMQHAAYLFLDRAWQHDQQTIDNICGYYKSCRSALSVSEIIVIRSLFDVSKKQIIERSRSHTSLSIDRIEKVMHMFNLARSVENN